MSHVGSSVYFLLQPLFRPPRSTHPATQHFDLTVHLLLGTCSYLSTHVAPGLTFVLASSSPLVPAEQYKHHWFPDRPCKGSGYRCIRINHKMDPLVGQAGQRIGLTIQQLYMLLPSELTLWVDPFEVSYRIGEDGSICVLYESQPCPPGTVAMVPPSGNPSGNSGPMGPMVDSHISCKEELMVLGRTSPSKSYNMMTVSS